MVFDFVVFVCLLVVVCVKARVEHPQHAHSTLAQHTAHSTRSNPPPYRPGMSSASSLVMQSSAPGMPSLEGEPPTAMMMSLA